MPAALRLVDGSPRDGWEVILSRFEVYQRAGNISPKTVQNREECYRMLAARTRRDPLDVTQDDLLSLLARNHARTGKPIAAGTKAAERSYLKALFRWLNEEGYRDDDPSARLPKVKIPRSQPRPFRAAQIDAILDGGIYRRTRDIIMIAAMTGLRIGEVVKIRGEDVDLDAMMISSLRKGGFEHRVPLHPDLLPLALSYPRQGWWFPSPYTNEKFPNGGGHILMASASDRISKAIRAAGITDHKITAHSLRHFYASQMLQNGANIRVVQENLGHASLATTQIYTEVTDQQKTEGVAVLVGFRPRTKSGRRPVVDNTRPSAVK